MCEICKREEVQKFIIWISASIALIGFFGTLTSYVIITDKATSQCNSNGTNCAGTNENDPGNNVDNKTLKILSPTALAVGFVIVVVMRCFQGGNRAVVSSNHDEPGPAFDMDGPPAYDDALNMDVVLEAHGSFPNEPPPKYDEILQYQLEGLPQNTLNVDNTSQSLNPAFEIGENSETSGSQHSETLEDGENETAVNNTTANQNTDIASSADAGAEVLDGNSDSNVIDRAVQQCSDASPRTENGCTSENVVRHNEVSNWNDLETVTV